ncbi:hypothetical protein T484DRAFT_1750879 [Baffinella frigidus]|nr:hypothetical protein T484DRAFT_1750879 [Cryptophyta sp. CCMP2293]
MRRPAPHVWLLLFALPGYTSRNGSGALGNAVPTRKVMGNCRAHRGDGAASSSSRCFRGLLPLNVKSTTGGSSIAESRTWLLSCPAAVEGEVQGSLVEKTCGGALKRSCTTRDHPADALRAPPRIVRSHLPGPPRISVEEKQRAGSGILRLRGAGEQSGSADEHGGSELRGSGEAPPFGGKDGGDVHEQTGRDEKLKWKR